MKNTLNKMGLLLLAAALCSCNNNNDNEVAPHEDNTILLSAGVSSNVATKAVVETGDEFTAAVAGWECNGNIQYNYEQTWLTSFSATASTTEQPVTLAERQVYHANSSILTYMKAWYPQGTLSEGMVDFSSDDEYAGDGTDDVLLAAELVGSKADRQNKVLNFAHMTTQLSFVVKEGDGLAANTKISKIEILGESIPTGLNLADHALVTAEKETLEVPSIDGELVIGTTVDGDKAGDPVMIAAPETNTVTLRVTTSTAVFENVVVTIDDDAAFKVGKAYEITLTFNQKEVELNAAVAEWENGTGAGVVE